MSEKRTINRYQTIFDLGAISGTLREAPDMRREWVEWALGVLEAAGDLLGQDIERRLPTDETEHLHVSPNNIERLAEAIDELDAEGNSE